MQERFQASEKENNDNTDKYLNIDNLPEGGLQVKVVFKTESENVLARIREASASSAEAKSRRYFPFTRSVWRQSDNEPVEIPLKEASLI